MKLHRTTFENVVIYSFSSLREIDGIFQVHIYPNPCTHSTIVTLTKPISTTYLPQVSFNHIPFP